MVIIKVFTKVISVVVEFVDKVFIMVVFVLNVGPTVAAVIVVDGLDIVLD